MVNSDDESEESSEESNEEGSAEENEDAALYASEGEDADDNVESDEGTADEESSDSEDFDEAAAEAEADEPPMDDAEEESEEGSFVQVGDVDEDDENAADTAEMEDKMDKVEGADEEAVDETDEEHTQTSDEEEAAETAKMEDDEDKFEGETSDEEASTSADQEGSESDDDSGESFIQEKSSWKPEHGSGVDLYEHPQGSTVITSCPVSSQTNTESCGAYFSGKADGQQCPQITCPKALGVTMKLTCSGGCCPTCWAPDHVIAVDRHTSIDDASVVDAAPQAASSCGGVKCFKLMCGPGYTEGFVNGACCYSCVPGR